MSADEELFAVLGLAASATEDEVRAAYLQRVKQHPPDRDPERFAEIRAAYEALRDPVRRARELVRRRGSKETLEGLRKTLRERLERPRHTLETLLALADER